MIERGMGCGEGAGTGVECDEGAGTEVDEGTGTRVQCEEGAGMHEGWGEWCPVLCKVSMLIIFGGSCVIIVIREIIFLQIFVRFLKLKLEFTDFEPRCCVRLVLVIIFRGSCVTIVIRERFFPANICVIPETRASRVQPLLLRTTPPPLRSLDSSGCYQFYHQCVFIS